MGAGPQWQLSLYDLFPDLRARRLQARRGSGPGDGLAQHTRCPAATGRGAGDAEAVAGPATQPDPQGGRAIAQPAAAPNCLHSSQSPILVPQGRLRLRGRTGPGRPRRLPAIRGRRPPQGEPRHPRRAAGGAAPPAGAGGVEGAGVQGGHPPSPREAGPGGGGGVEGVELVEQARRDRRQQPQLRLRRVLSAAAAAAAAPQADAGGLPLLPARSRTAPTQCLASSPHHHLRPSTAHYVARPSALQLKHCSALATRCTPLFFPKDPSFRHHVATFRSRNDALGDKQHPAQPAPVQHSELCPPFTPAVRLPDVFSAERGASLSITDLLRALPRPGRATRSSTPEPSPAGAGTSSP